jgi:1-deoxyxylulose-5-phosphate synthase
MQAMEFRMIGKTDLRISRLGLGAMTFGSQVAEVDAIRMVDRCLGHEINFYDTANVYNQGRSEIILGKALRGRRHNVILATKVRGKMGEEPDEVGLKRPAIRRALDASLKRLGTDYVDLYYLHHPDRDTRIEETLATMDDLVRAGKIRYPAVSNCASWQVAQMLWLSDNLGYTPPTVSQPMYNLLARGIEQEHLAFCKDFGVAVVAYNPLAGGLLTGKHMPESAPAAGTRFDGNKMYLDRYWHSSYFRAQQEVSAIAQQTGMSTVTLAIRWLLARPQIDSVLLGASTMVQLEENLNAYSGLPLDADIMAQCDGVWERLRGLTPKYNR